VRNAPVFEQADHRRHGHAVALGVQHQAVLFFGFGHALEHQHQSPPRAADVDRLIGGVQDQYGHLHDLAGLGPALGIVLGGVGRCFCE